MYVVRLRRTDGKIARRVEFPDVRDALRHMDAFVRAFPQRPSEVVGSGGVLFCYDPSAGQAAEAGAAS